MFPTRTVFGIPLRKCCIYGSILEIILFIIPSTFYYIVWDAKQQDNRALFGIILVLVLMLSVFLLMGAYFRESLFILIWIVGTILVQFVVNVSYSFLYVLSLSSLKIWGYSILETIFTIVQTVVGIIIMWFTIGYYKVLLKRQHDRSLLRLHTQPRQQEQTDASNTQSKQNKPVKDDKDAKDQPDSRSKSTKPF